ncbi:MAG: BlaI/MecI/CopY family transcriptional regulator [Acidobacteriaceae bacterium]
MAKRANNLTGLELEIMQVLWKRGASNVGEVRQGMGRELAYTTVQTVLNTLHRKGKLRRKLDGRAYVYSATVTQTKALRHAVRDLVDRMFGGSSEELVLSLIKSREIDPKRIARMSREIDEDEEEA